MNVIYLSALIAESILNHVQTMNVDLPRFSRKIKDYYDSNY